MSELKRIVIMATAPIALPTLDTLHQAKDFEVVGVYSQPDRPAGRKRKLTASAIKLRALELGIPVYTPEKIGTAEDELRGLAPDITVVFAYGQYIPKRIFALPDHGSINLHPSLLPHYRGASPIQSAIAAGDRMSGISVIDVGEEMDAGDILAQCEVPIGREDTSASMTERFSLVGAELMLGVLRGLRDEHIFRTPQDESHVTETSKLSKSDGHLNWGQVDSRVFDCRVRAYTPWPSVMVPLPGGPPTLPLKILAVKPEAGQGTPGEILDLKGAGPLIATADGAVRLTQVQPPGKAPMDGKSFLNGHRWELGQILPSWNGEESLGIR